MCQSNTTITNTKHTMWKHCYMFRLWVIFWPSWYRSIQRKYYALWDPQRSQYLWWMNKWWWMNELNLSATRIGKTTFSTTPPEVNHPGLGTHPAFTRQATSCRFLPRYKTATYSENYIILNIDIKWNNQQTNPGIYYVTRKTRLHFTTQPLAVNHPAFCNAGSKTTSNPPTGVTCTHHSFHIFPGST